MKRKMLCMLLLLTGCIVFSSCKENENVVVVGGADGPTSVFVAGTMSEEESQEESQVESQVESQEESQEPEQISLPTLTLIGHSSVKIVTQEEKVIYIDPFYKGDYTQDADILLVTHDHSDHNQVSLVPTTDTTQIVTAKEALIDGEYQTFDFEGITVEAVAAYNKNHPKEECVGYIITFDGITLYHAGDTSYITEMDALADRSITYCMLPIDGKYNMDAKEATECANVINAAYSIPMHTAGGMNPYNQTAVDNFTPTGKLEIPYGTTVSLEIPQAEE